MRLSHACDSSRQLSLPIFGIHSHPKQKLLLEIVKSHLHEIYIDGINLEEISSIFSSNQIKLLPHQLTKPLLIMHDACDFVPRWIYIPDSMRHSGNCNGSKSLWSNPNRQQSSSCKLVETEVWVLSILLISKYCPKIETQIPKEKVLKRRRKKALKRKIKFETWHKKRLLSKISWF